MLGLYQNIRAFSRAFENYTNLGRFAIGASELVFHDLAIKVESYRTLITSNRLSSHSIYALVQYTLRQSEPL